MEVLVVFVDEVPDSGDARIQFVLFSFAVSIGDELGHLLSLAGELKSRLSPTLGWRVVDGVVEVLEVPAKGPNEGVASVHLEPREATEDELGHVSLSAAEFEPLSSTPSLGGKVVDVVVVVLPVPVEGPNEGVASVHLGPREATCDERGHVSLSAAEFKPVSPTPSLGGMVVDVVEDVLEVAIDEVLEFVGALGQ